MSKQWVSKRLTINLAKIEMELLAAVSEKTGRSITDLVRESIRITYKEFAHSEKNSPRLP
ncbi:MAG: CopG family transcriptional regulator [Brasilonema angustatum HA4187-MV1]|jgi:predicted DNA-binding protein|nr:CopG family transcriptional regulator [Brasilonema sp. CT11]MBW4596985.1 CopG family transcriptional regulator [Brasilonema angustatum HA4187-MV1]